MVDNIDIKMVIDNLKNDRINLENEIHKIIVGQNDVIEKTLIGLFTGGHILIEGVPGLAKTLLISTIAKALNLSFNRIQFTPDLMPSDITGSEVMVVNEFQNERQFRFIKGPVFANIILADEINRTPPKTQAALLQAMQEHQVTSGNSTFNLDLPFIVMATQNPIEQEGTYPLPEAQLDRFMFYINIDYPSFEDEIKIVETTTNDSIPQIKAILSADQIKSYQHVINQLPVSDHVKNYAVRAVRATRPSDTNASNYIKKWVNWGAGPRASQFLVMAAKTRAALSGRLTPAEEDVRYIAPIVLQHRILVSFAAEAEGIKSVDIINQVLEKL